MQKYNKSPLTLVCLQNILGYWICWTEDIETIRFAIFIKKLINLSSVDILFTSTKKNQSPLKVTKLPGVLEYLVIDQQTFTV